MTDLSSPRPGYYQHYKGHFYQVLMLATHSETEEVLVIYRALYGERGHWARPLSMFTETVVVEGQHLSRFRPVSEEEYRQKAED